MTRTQVGIRAIIAAPAAGALCALGFLVVLVIVGSVQGGEGVSAEDLGFLLVVWLAFAAPVGFAAGVALGIVPVLVTLVAWPALERRLGTGRAVDVVVLVVGVIGFAEALLVAWAFEPGLPEAVGWALGAAAISALTLRWILRRGQRAAERRARLAATY